MSRGVLFDPSNGEILRSPLIPALNRILFNPEESPSDIIYYGKVSGGTTWMPTSSYIKSNFSTTTGNVGGAYPSPKQYIFDANLGKHIYLIWPDLPSGSTYGYRAINLVRNTTSEGSPSQVDPIYNIVYQYTQIDPLTTAVSPYILAQTQTYGKIDIDGIIYRVWKSANTNSDINVYVYSI
jgi:hypothetical protein